MHIAKIIFVFALILNRKTQPLDPWHISKAYSFFLQEKNVHCVLHNNALHPAQPSSQDLGSACGWPKGSDSPKKPLPLAPFLVHQDYIPALQTLRS